MKRATDNLTVRSSDRAWALQQGPDLLADGPKRGPGQGGATKRPRRAVKAERRAANARARATRRRNR